MLNIGRGDNRGAKPRRAVVVGCSAGGMDALAHLLEPLPADFPVGIAVVNHLHPHSATRQMSKYLKARCRLDVVEAEEKEPFLPGRVHLAPANYHLLLESSGRFALSIDEKVKYSRPSIDVLFESAAEVFRETLVGIILSGASSDGADGLAWIKAAGGYAIVQDPETADVAVMPRSAIAQCAVDRVLPVQAIGELLGSSIRDGELRI